MSDSESHTPLESAQPGPQKPPGESGGAEEKQFDVAEMMVGTAMIFVGFLNVLLSISGGFEISVLPLILYFAGLAIWAHARMNHPTLRYIVITVCFAAAAGFFSYGEVHFWHKQVVFWGTVILVSYFMFTGTTTKKSQK